MKFLLFLPLLLLSNQFYAQVIDFENLKDKEPGQSIHFVKLPDNPCEVRFFIGHNLQDTSHLTLQKVGITVQNEGGLTGGFQGITNNKNCHEKVIPQTRMNQINYNSFVLNEEINNRARVGCHFVSTILRGDNLPSVFVHFSIPTGGCSGDILDLDGADDAIEAYEIYYYESEEDFPSKPINNDPIRIRTTSKSFGKGEIGEDGGVVPFSIESGVKFKLIEIRPNQQVSPENKFRNVFGFALDNFSPFDVEAPPYLPPYLTGEIIEISTIEPIKEIEIIQEENPTFKPLFFDFDKSTVSSNDKLEPIETFLKKHPNKKIRITGYADPKGSNEYNVDLSKRRVENTKNTLVSLGIRPDQIEIEYKGEINNSSEEDWEKRKVEIRVLD